MKHTEIEDILDEQFKRLDGTTVLPIYNRPTAVGQSAEAISDLVMGALPEYNSKLSRDYFQPNSNPMKAHKNGYRLAIRDIKANLKQRGIGE